MSEVLVRYTASVTGEDGVTYIPQACGGIADDGLWEGWIEFVSPTGSIRTPRETEQPNRDDLMYWAQGLSAAYLEGAFVRAASERKIAPVEPLISPVFDRPAAPPSPRAFKPQRAVLDPFTTFDQGEDLLRGQLSALSHDNLVAIVEDYGLDIREPHSVRSGLLIESIVAAVRARSRAA
jgi:hypothetical protein